jgi:hypothetical protein
MRWAVTGLGTSTSTPILATLWLKASSFLTFLPYQTAAQVSQAPVEQRGVTILYERFIRRARDAGVAVLAWTINEPAEMHANSTRSTLDKRKSSGLNRVSNVRVDTLRSLSKWARRELRIARSRS